MPQMHFLGGSAGSRSSCITRLQLSFRLLPRLEISRTFGPKIRQSYQAMAVVWPCSLVPSGPRTLRTPKKWRTRRISSSRASTTRLWRNELAECLGVSWELRWYGYCNGWRRVKVAHEWFGEWLGSRVFFGLGEWLVRLW